MLDELASVLTLPFAAIAAISGLLFGLVLLRATMSAAGLSRREYALKTFIILLFAGTLFYAGQFVTLTLSDNDLVGRLVGRYLLWVIFAAGSAAGTYLRGIER